MRLVKEKTFIYKEILKLDVVGSDPHRPLQSLKINWKQLKRPGLRKDFLRIIFSSKCLLSSWISFYFCVLRFVALRASCRKTCLDDRSHIAGPGEVSIAFLVDEKPSVLPVGSGEERSGGARKVP